MKNRGTTKAFEVTKVRWACRYMACRGAVLTRIFGKDWPSYGVPEAMGRLRRMWHKKLMLLEQAGWSRLKSRLNMQYMRNCPPFGVTTDDKSRRCDVQLLCPFCYARRNVLDSFMQLEMALFGSFHPQAKLVLPHKDLRLIEFTRIYPLWPHKGVPWSVDSRDALIYTVKQLIRQQRNTEVEYFRPIGGVVLHRMDMRKRNWPLIRSGVLIRDPSVGEIPALPKEWQELIDSRLLFIEKHPRDRINKTLLSRIVSRRFYYPSGLLTWPEEDVVAYVEGMRHVKMKAQIGICRSDTLRKHFLGG